MSARRKKPDLVLGLGATGLSVARWLARNDREAIFADTRDDPPGTDELRELFPDAELLCGDFELPDDIARVIASPGIPDHHPLLEAARERRLKVISDIQLFVGDAAAPFVAVTGSNGKSTVTTLVEHMCNAGGRQALAGGNLGQPALDLLADAAPDVYVLELSSFQLQRTARLPAEVAVLLNVATDHLDWHADEAEYAAAKYRIFRQARAAVINRADPEAAKRCRKIEQVISFGLDAPDDGHYGIREEGGRRFIARGDVLLLGVDEMRLVGTHNQANALAALAAGELLGIGPNEMLPVLCEFPGLPHRMQKVARVASVDYINDSKATNVAAAIASIASIDGTLVLIAGGDGKGAGFAELGKAVDGRLRAAVLLGTDAERIAAALDSMLPVAFASDMKDAVQKAADLAESDDTVLLAPACASFDQFENYQARGNAFATAVGELRR